MGAEAAARLGDEIAHGPGMAAMLAGAVVGAIVGAAIVTAAAVAAPLTVAIIISGSVAAGALSMKQLVRGFYSVFKLPEPPSGALMKGSSNVFINSRPAIRAGIDAATPCTGQPLNHPPLPAPVLVAEGSASVFINGQPVARLKDKLVCGAHISGGSSNVFIGGGTQGTGHDVHDLEQWVELGFEWLGAAALVGAGALAASAGIGALAIFGAVALGINAGLNGLGKLGDRLGPGYGDLLQGAGGLGLLLAGPRMAKKGGANQDFAVTSEEIRTLPKGDRPSPSEYLSKGYIDDHLAKFNNGASFITKKSSLEIYGREQLGMPDNSQFVMPKTQMDEVLTKANGDVSIVEQELGVPKGSWQNHELVRIDIPKPESLDVRMPSGNEMGANEHWLPGGKLPTGYDEAVVNQIPAGSYVEHSLW